MPFADTVAAIREQGGLVYVPHPFDRMHAIPDPHTLHRHLADIDVFEVYNARLLFEAYNDEALRFAQKYNLTRGAGSDAHVLQGVGTGALRMRSFDDPEEFLLFTANRRGSAAPEVARVPPVAEVDGAGQGEGPVDAKGPGVAAVVTTDEIHQRYLDKAIPEINRLHHDITEAADGGVAAQPTGHPLATIFLLKYGPQAQELQEGVAFHGRAGHALIKSLQRLRVDASAVYGTNCVKFAGADESQVADVARARAPHRPAEAARGDGRGRVAVRERPRVPALSPARG